jgi:hypothetical protein
VVLVSRKRSPNTRRRAITIIITAVIAVVAGMVVMVVVVTITVVVVATTVGTTRAVTPLRVLSRSDTLRLVIETCGAIGCHERHVYSWQPHSHGRVAGSRVALARST